MKIGFNPNINFSAGYATNTNLNAVNHNAIPNTGSTKYSWENLFSQEKRYDPKKNVIYISQKGVKDGNIRWKRIGK